MQTSLDAHGMNGATVNTCQVLWYIIDFPHFEIRGIADNYVKPSGFQDTVEFSKPVEGLMGFPPLGEGFFILILIRDVASINSVFACQIVVKLAGETPETGAEVFLSFGKVFGRHALFRL